MNKITLIIVSLLFSSIGLLANSFDSREFSVTSTSSEEVVSLSTDVFKTVYETRRVLATCYRSVPQTRCRRVCRNNRCQRTCRRVVIRRAYSCYVNRSVAVKKFDYENISSSRFTFDFSNIQDDDVDEAIKVSQTGKKLSIKARSSGRYLIKVQKLSENVSRDYKVRYVNRDFVVRLTDVSFSQQVLGKGIRGFSIRNNILSFQVGSGFNLDDFSFNLRLYKYRSLAKDKLLFNKRVQGLVRVEDNGQFTTVNVPLRKLGVKIPKKKRIIIDLKREGIDTRGSINLSGLHLKQSINKVIK